MSDLELPPPTHGDASAEPSYPHAEAELRILLNLFPDVLAESAMRLIAHQQTDLPVEFVLDVGRPPLVRFTNDEFPLSAQPLTQDIVDAVSERVGRFASDNRAGLDGTLHRIAAVRNRHGRVIGLTCRIGRVIRGVGDPLRDLLHSQKSVLIIGPPGSGKTTLLRDIARLLSEDLRRRVVIVDTSNEIAGDGDIPHPGIGRARRLQVANPQQLHSVMIEAVENHTPQVVVIDEISNKAEAAAARTIAERGVQLIGTAHGTTIENLLVNPALVDLVGGIQHVTIGDQEAISRGTQKIVLERCAPPTFDVLVEIESFRRYRIYSDVASAVDGLLRGQTVDCELRGDYAATRDTVHGLTIQNSSTRELSILLAGIDQSRAREAAKVLGVDLTFVRDVSLARAVLAVPRQIQRNRELVSEANERGVPIFALRSPSLLQIGQALRKILQDGSRTGGPGYGSPSGIISAKFSAGSLNGFADRNGHSPVPVFAAASIKRGPAA